VNISYLVLDDTADAVAGNSPAWRSMLADVTTLSFESRKTALRGCAVPMRMGCDESRRRCGNCRCRLGDLTDELVITMRQEWMRNDRWQVARGLAVCCMSSACRLAACRLLFAAHLLRNDRTQARDGRWFSGADEFKYVEGVTSKTETFAGVRDENNTNMTPVSSVHTVAWSGFHTCGRYPCLP
jgi:hypothetical protein